ncbi:SWIM zinc finger family protein [Planococcus lenghuensis]|uniref:SWIM-type domain-containing protein n=1 Tax=Planococcus lenghuensis TaxID=2213202 RepID=A0A1Q2L3X3_9BACL|nr:SWIM zinc finger family protein [Planococcus lenghuensis]AQQ55150.1 hypothetical protein B0X71_14920 [Planococcus lenghuensis]
MATVQALAKRFEETISDFMTAVDSTLHPSSERDEEMVRKAVFFVRHGGVTFQSFNEETQLLEATVKDVHTVKVVLNFNDLLSSCSCPEEDMCRHRLAVIFGLYQKVGSLSGWVADWRAKKNEQLLLMPDERSPAQWLAIVKSVWQEPIPEYTRRNFFYFSQLYENRLNAVLAYLPFEREWKTLFRVYAHFLSLVHAWEFYRDGIHEMHHSFFGRWLEEEIQSLTSLLEQLSVQHRTFAHDPFFDVLEEQVHRFAEKQDETFAARFSVYRLFWELLFTTKRLREQEAARIAGTDNRLEVFFDLLLNREIGDIQPAADELSVWIELAELARENGRQDAMQRILSGIRPHVERFLFNEIHPQYREANVKTLSRLFTAAELSESEWEELFSQFGRYGLPAYSAYLIDRQEFRKWAELHQRHRSPLYFAEECGLKEVQAAAPDCVLPLYHFYALQHVEERSRSGYKQAVRIWKRMKTACKKSGQLPFFESYMNEIKLRYKRLRALQQEIEKGQLV